MAVVEHGEAGVVGDPVAVETGEGAEAAGEGEAGEGDLGQGDEMARGVAAAAEAEAGGQVAEADRVELGVEPEGVGEQEDRVQGAVVDAAFRSEGVGEGVGRRPAPCES